MGGLRYLIGLVGLIVTLGCTPGGPINGRIGVTEDHGGRVSGNIFASAGDVYLKGGPLEPHGLGLRQGTYVVAVTDLSGSKVLSDYITVEVSNGRFEQLVRLAPFDSAPDGIYKVWATPESEWGSADFGVNGAGFAPWMSRTDVFAIGYVTGSTTGSCDEDDGTDPPPGDDCDDNPPPDDPCDTDPPDPCDASFGSQYGDIFGDIYGNVIGDIYGDHFGDLYGDLVGNRIGDHFGDHYGDHYGDTYGDHFGDQYGNHYGTTYGDHFGDSIGD